MTNLSKLKIVPGAFLLLDRDGVINRNLPNDYVKTWDEFEFLPRVPEAIARLRKIFKRILVFSNQQGVGKGLMRSADVVRIHERMTRELATHGAIIDHIYFCPHLESEQCECRKPRQGMIKLAQANFPDFRAEHAVMVGDKQIDMQFGQIAGAQTVMIGNVTLHAKTTFRVVPSLIDLCDIIDLS
ncbi:MAG: HAD family hydrolase [Candidatus Margulisiibacteriota bacterium]